MTSTLVDFQTAVLDASERQPVLVDFWASWCGPCKMLAPVLEKLAAGAGGRWSLVKIDTDEQPELAERFAIRSIPSVKLFHRGRVIAEFAGALPEFQLRQWLEQHLPTPQRAVMARARELLRAGQATEAASLLTPLVAMQGADAELLALAARAAAFVDPAQARTLVARIEPGSPWADEAAIAIALADALDTPDHRTLPPPLREAYLAALRDLRSQNFHAAAAGLVTILQERPDYDVGRAKAACLALFKHLGLRHGVSEEFSRAYSMAVNV